MKNKLLKTSAAIIFLFFTLAGAGLSAEEVKIGRQNSWHDDFISRVQVLALLQTLNATLLSNNSATLTLDRWCADHKLASSARITAQLDRHVKKEPTAEQRQLLDVNETERVNYRRVRLVCGNSVLSVADNWYVPGRLTPAMNQALETSDIAFGRAVQALRFHRRTLSAKLLWSPLPEGWEMEKHTDKHAIEESSAFLTIPEHVLQQHAVLTLPDGTPFSLVIETYTSAVLDFQRR